MDYSESGVNILAGERFARLIGDLAKSTHTKEVYEGIGGFCSLYQNPAMQNYVLAASTDGVGTKVLLAKQLKEYGYLGTIGIDLVAMVVNDIVTCGAQPLFLLDYYGVANLKADNEIGFPISGQIMKGIVEGCKQADCALLGGETAEMPDIYTEDKFDLAAFGVGSVHKDDIIGQSFVEENDVVVGIESSGPHSNGFTLIRKIFKDYDWDLDYDNVRDAIMTPTNIYVKFVRELVSNPCVMVDAIAHITGGGIVCNTNRVINHKLEAVIDWDSWERPIVFEEIQERGKISEDEMQKVFNCGIGLTVISRELYVTKIIEAARKYGFDAWTIGKVKSI